MPGREIETAIGGNAHLPDTERPSEHVRTPGLPPDEVDMIDEKAFAGGRPDAIERPYDPGGLGEINDQPERSRAARPEGYEPLRDGPPHDIAGGPATPNFERGGRGKS